MAVDLKRLIPCVLIAFLLCFAQILGSTPLIAGVLFLFLVLLVWSCFADQTLPILLFFLPWSPLMKLYSGSISFFTVGLMGICVISLIKSKFNIGRKELVISLALVLLTLVAKLPDGAGLSMGYLAFVIMLFFLPTVKRRDERGNAYGFYAATVFLAVGVITAALCAEQFADYPNIRKYIVVTSIRTLTRKCGFYGDPNYYAAHITAALAGCFLMLLRGKGKQIAVSATLCVLLLYCGLLSGSKSFAVAFALIFLLWACMLLRMRGRGGLKLLLLVLVAAAVVFVASSVVFRELIDTIFDRFAAANNMLDLTTHRSTIWKNYIIAILTDPKVLLVGKGMTEALVNGSADHNSLIQLVFQFGLIGLPLVAAWCLNFGRSAQAEPNAQRRSPLAVLMLIGGCFLPWFAVSILFFDEFFLIQWFFALALTELRRSPQSDGDPLPRQNVLNRRKGKKYGRQSD